MRNFIYLSFYELRMLFYRPATYATAFLFLLIESILYLFIIEYFSRSAQDGLVSLHFFESFWIPLFFMVPLITMKSIADERRQGTLETLITTSVTAAQTVGSKFVAAYCFYLILWLLTLSFPVAVWHTAPATALDNDIFNTTSLLGGYIFIALSGALYIAIGLLCSSLTRSQLIAGMLTFSFLFLVIVGSQSLMQLPSWDLPLINTLEGPIEYLQTFSYLNDFSHGIIDSRPVILYLTNAAILLGLATLVVEAKA